MFPIGPCTLQHVLATWCPIEQRDSIYAPAVFPRYSIESSVMTHRLPLPWQLIGAAEGLFFIILRPCLSDKSGLSNIKTLNLLRMASSGMLRRVALIRTDVSEEPSASIIRVTRICELGTTLECVGC
jgi:hypothetical protein